MRRVALLALIAGIAGMMFVSDAQAEGGKMRLSHFFNFEWLRDADGDGIPNCLDDDWTPPQDGSGYQGKHGNGTRSSDSNSNDAQGQGIFQNKHRNGSNNGSGLGDKTKTQLRSRDGSCS